MPSSESRQLAYRPNHTQTDFTARQIESPVDSEPQEIVACGVDLVAVEFVSGRAAGGVCVAFMFFTAIVRGLTVFEHLFSSSQRT